MKIKVFYFSRVCTRSKLDWTLGRNGSLSPSTKMLHGLVYFADLLTSYFAKKILQFVLQNRWLAVFVV